MAIPNRGTMRTNMRLLMQDPGTTPQALTDIHCNELLNRGMLLLCPLFPERFVVSQESWVSVGGAVQNWTPSGAVNVRRIISIGVTGVRRLERTELNKLLQKQEASPSVGSPRRYYAHLDTNQTASDNRWKVYLYPTGAATMDVSYEFYPPELTTDSDKPRFPDAECKWIEALGAARGAWLNGKDKAFVDGILADIPQQIQTHFQVTDWLKQPRSRPNEVIA